MPRFLLPTVQEVLHLLDRQQVPGVKVQLDFYHVTRMGQEALPLTLVDGQIVLAGSFTRPVVAKPGDMFEADYGPLGKLQFRFV